MPRFFAFTLFILCLAVMALGGGFVGTAMVLAGLYVVLCYAFAAWVFVAPLFTPRR